MIRRGSARDIIITIPKSIEWSEYQKELVEAENGGTLNFKVSQFPNTTKGRKCYLVYDGHIRGYMIICGLSEKEFDCTTTGKNWKGKFIERSGKFFPIDPVPMKGFQGFRYYGDEVVNANDAHDLLLNPKFKTISSVKMVIHNTEE